MMSRKRILPLAAASGIGVVAIALAAGFTPEPPPPRLEHPGITLENDGIRLAPGAPQWKSLQIGQATRSTSHWSDGTPARVQIDERLAARVGAPLPGRVRTVHVELGEKVKAGQPLFTLTSLHMADLRAEKEKADVDLALARSARERIEALVAVEALPAKEAVLANQAFRQAESAHRQARARLAAVREKGGTGSSFTVTAPRDGVVVEKNVLPQQEVSPEGETLLVVADTSSVWVVADLLSSQVASIREGIEARVEIPTLPGVVATGTVERISAIVDPIRHTIPVRIKVDNTEGHLRPNLFVLGRFRTSEEEGPVEVAASALVTDGKKQFVYVQAEEGRFERRPVVARSSRAGRVPIVAGLSTGESVVEKGAILLENHLSLHD